MIQHITEKWQTPDVTRFINCIITHWDGQDSCSFWEVQFHSVHSVITTPRTCFEMYTTTLKGLSKVVTFSTAWVAADFYFSMKTNFQLKLNIDYGAELYISAPPLIFHLQQTNGWRDVAKHISHKQSNWHKSKKDCRSIKEANGQFLIKVDPKTVVFFSTEYNLYILIGHLKTNNVC